MLSLSQLIRGALLCPFVRPSVNKGIWQINGGPISFQFNLNPFCKEEKEKVEEMERSFNVFILHKSSCLFAKGARVVLMITNRIED